MRVEVIGVGYWGKKIVDEYIKMGKNIIVPDIKKENLNFCEEKYDIKTMTDYKDILSGDRITAVNVCTSNATHFRIAKDWLLAGKNVLVEKQLTLKVEEAEDLANIAVGNNLVLTVWHIFRFDNAIQHVEKIMEIEEKYKISGEVQTKKPNLLIITDRYPHNKDPLASSFVYSQIDALKKYFDTIYVISLNPFIPKLFSMFSFMHPRWRKDAFATDYRYDNVEVRFARYFMLPFDFVKERKGKFAYKVAKRIIEREKMDFDLIHAHFTWPSGYVSAKLKAIYKKPVVLTVHEEREGFLNEISSGDKKFSCCWRNADKIIRVNKRDLNEFENIGIEKSKLLSIPNGFCSDLFKPMNINIVRKELGLPENKKILLNIANLEEYKGQKYLVAAMKYILAKRNDVMLYIVGEGSLKNRLQSLINKYRLEDNIVLAGGNKPSKEIPLWMNACNVFVLPSLSEGNPTVMFECLGCGKPFVGTRVGGIPEIITNEKLGILVEPKDADGFAKAILKALDTKWDKNYILNYAEQFTWDKIAEKIRAVYDEVLKKS